jgi:uncharacterized protein (TIGR02118 family)
MVKLIFLCRRRSDITHERYAELLLRGHVPLALVHHPAMRGYVVNLVVNAGGEAEELDSIGELFFDSLEDFRQRLYDSGEGRAAIERDVAGFLGGADAYAAQEIVQKRTRSEPALGTRSPGVKMIAPIRRREGMTHAQFVDHWLGTHVPLALRHHPGMCRYVTNVIEQKLSPTGTEWDGIAELHFATAEDLRRGLFDSKEGEQVIRADIERFIGGTYPYFVSEYVQRRPPQRP